MISLTSLDPKILLPYLVQDSPEFCLMFGSGAVLLSVAG